MNDTTADADPSNTTPTPHGANPARLSPARSDSARSNSAWHSPWVIGWIGLLVIVVSVNLVMITLAFVTGPGLVVDNAYDRGKELEETITSRQAATPDWTMRLDTEPGVVAGIGATVRVVVVDRAGQPLRADQVTYQAYRPADAGLDFAVPMAAEAPGRYAATVTFPAPGIWDTLVLVQSADKAHALDQRVSVARP